MEYWNNGVMGSNSSTPALHYSDRPKEGWSSVVTGRKRTDDWSRARNARWRDASALLVAAGVYRSTEAERTARKSQTAGRRFCSVPRWRRQVGPPGSPLLSSRHVIRVRAGGGRRHQVLLPRLAL